MDKGTGAIIGATIEELKQYLKEKEKEKEENEQKKNCTKCKFCENIHNDKKLTILDYNNIFRALICGVCGRYDIEVSENDCCSNFEEKGDNINE